MKLCPPSQPYLSTTSLSACCHLCWWQNQTCGPALCVQGAAIVDSLKPRTVMQQAPMSWQFISLTAKSSASFFFFFLRLIPFISVKLQSRECKRTAINSDKILTWYLGGILDQSPWLCSALITTHCLSKPSLLNTFSYQPLHFTAHGQAVCPRTCPDLR